MTAGAKRSAALILDCLAFVLCGAAARQNANNSQVANQSHIPLKVTSNLVLVRVVVRDAQGKAVEGLKKEDFRLFDRGKEQPIVEFESSVPAASAVSSEIAPFAASETSSVHMSTPALPEKFLALYFDDLNAAEDDMVYAREAAARYLASNLDSQERVAIFTPEKMVIDFSSDHKRIDEALANLHAISRSPTQGSANCPNLSDDQALEITRSQFDLETDAWQTALNEAVHCGGGGASSPVATASSGNTPPQGGLNGGAPPINSNQNSSLQVLQMAQLIVNRMRVQARENLQQLSEVVKYISKMPGQSTVVLVSPGFLSQDDQVLLDKVIDRALHSQVVISSLDPKGLALLMGESDALQRRGSIGGVSSARHRLDAARETFATDVLEEVAEGTGGNYVHDSNDLKCGFSRTAGSPAYYILGFAASNMKPDGKFHALKVVLAEGEKGMTLQARRGYFAPANEAEAEAELKENEAADAEAQRHEQLRETLFSANEIAQFPLDLHVSVSRRPKETHDVSLYSHIDGEMLHLAKDGERNRDTVRFFFAVFDQQGNVIASQARDAKMDVVDSQMAELRKTGLNVGVTFQLKPGKYRVREVATELEGHEMATVTRDVEISAHEKVESASVVPWDPPDVDAPVGHLSSSNTCSISEVLSLAAGPAKSLVDNLQNFDAHEQIRYEQTDNSGEQSLSMTAHFDYLVDFTRKNNHLGVREIRTPLTGTDPSLKDSISDNGLPVLALIFGPSLRNDYEMRCEGTDVWANRPAWVIYFRQMQGKRPRTAAIPTATEVYPVSLKGRAWIATDSGEVMHLETNLVKGIVILSPQPTFIRVDSVSVDYAPVRFVSKDVVMWLPQSEVTFTDYGDRHMIIQHTFSDFRLFSVQSSQTIQTPNPQQ
jgi:VWFA-related protein